jgi:hypothetical protein
LPSRFPHDCVDAGSVRPEGIEAGHPGWPTVASIEHKDQALAKEAEQGKLTTAEEAHRKAQNKDVAAEKPGCERGYSEGQQ